MCDVTRASHPHPFAASVLVEKYRALCRTVPRCVTSRTLIIPTHSLPLPVSLSESIALSVAQCTVCDVTRASYSHFCVDWRREGSGQAMFPSVLHRLTGCHRRSSYEIVINLFMGASSLHEER